jgi:hypothetical protein
MGRSIFSGRVFILLLLLLACRVVCADRQLIYTGWDSPTAPAFREGLAEFERWKLFDGATILPTRRLADGKVVSCADAFSTNHWQWSELEPCVADLQAARPLRCTNNFLMFGANPGNVSWFDDQGWAEIVDHWRLLARAARKGGLAGLLFDAEAYRRPWWQFLYTAQSDKASHSFAEMSAKARERGRAVMKAVAEEYPDMTLFTYRIFSDLLHSGDPAKPRVNLQTHIYGLIPAFVDGWCDALPPGITLIDGNESAFNYQSESEFAATFARLKTEAPGFVSLENRAKIKRQFLVTHGFYLDAYSPAPGGKTYFDLHGVAPADRLTTFVLAAADATDAFLWIYGENARFWPSPKPTRPTWPEKFAGVENALRAGKDPTEFAHDFLNVAKTDGNLLHDAAFAPASATNRTKAWSIWQDTASKGSVAFTNHAIVLTGVENGTIGQTVAVKRGEVYAVGAKVKVTSAGDFGISISWQDASQKWVAPSERVEFAPADAPDADGWQSISGLVRVPIDATALGFLMFARRQENGTALFRDPIVARVSHASK